MAKKIPLEKKPKRRKRVRRVVKKSQANVVDVRPLEPQKISFEAVNEKSIREISERDLSSLHLRCHQLYEGIRGRLLGMKVQGFVAKAIQERRASNFVSTSKVETELPVYIVAEGKAHALAEISSPEIIEPKSVRAMTDGLIDASNVYGYSGRQKLFAYKILTLESFDKPRAYREEPKHEKGSVIMGVNLIGVNLKLTLSDIIRVHKIIVEEIDRRGMNHKIVGEIDTKTVLLRRVQKMKVLPEEKTDDELIELHKRIHSRFNEKGTTERLQVVHAYIVEEMSARGLPHITDESDALDLMNKGFREGLAKRKPGDSLSRVHLVNEKQKVELGEVLTMFESFKLREPYIYLIGDLVEKGETESAIDILIKGSESITEKMKPVVEWRILNSFPVELQSRVVFHYDDYEGSMTPFVELFDLTATRVSGNEIIKKSKVVRIDRARQGKEIPTKKGRTRLTKAKDPFLEIPAENEIHKFVAQSHFIGKGVHSDLRMEYANPRFLIGWTLNTQIPGSIKEPVTTMKEASSLNPGTYSKINWKNGDWKKRRRNSGAMVNETLRAERKSPSPKEWLNVQGVIEPGDPGASANLPGVLLKVDSGSVEYGAQKSDSHEYFFDGKVLKSRIVFRRLNMSQVSADKLLELINNDAGIKEVFLQKLFDADLEDEIFFELEKRAHSLPVELKEIMSAEYEERPLSPGEVGWICIKTENQLPYVLSREAINKKWVPPENYSALPKNIRSKIPTEFHYWLKKSDSERIAIRDALVEAMKKEEVKLPVEVNKLSEIDARFVLQKQTFENDDESEYQREISDDDEFYDVRIDVGAGKLLRIRVADNPIENQGNEIQAVVAPENDKDRMNFEGEVEPGSPMNPSKEYSSEISIIDSGKCSIIDKKQGYFEIVFGGDELKGTWVVEQISDAENNQWLMKQTELSPDETTEKRQVEITKVNKKLRLVTGVVLKPEDRDAHNDIYSEDVIRQAAHDFVANYNETTAIGFMHADFSKKLLLVESYVAPMPMQINGRDVPKGAWVITVKVLDDEIWQKVLNKEIRAFSIGGLATAIPG